MLNFFNSFVVPGVDDVTFYHDDQDPQQFYMLPEFPTIKTGPDNTPMFNLIIFARDFHLFANQAQGLDSTETEGGIVSMTTQLGVSDADQQTAVNYIQNDMGNDPIRRFRPIYHGPGQIGFAPLFPFTIQQPPKLSYPIWVEPPPSAVNFSIIPDLSTTPSATDTFIKATASSNHPSLIAENLASYEALLGQEGVELFRDTAAKGAVIGLVSYTVSFVARIPSISIHIYGDASNIYQEIKQYCTVHEDYGSGGSWTYPQVSSLDELKQISASLHIDINDNDFQQASSSTSDGSSGSTASSIESQIETLALNIATTYLQSTFFANPFPTGLDASKLGTTPFANNPNPPASQPGQPGQPGAGGSGAPANNQLWLKNFTQDMEGHFDFQISASSNITVTKYPNSALSTLLPASLVASKIITADLSQPYFQILDVSVQVTADYVNDPIAAITVTLSYVQTDDNTQQGYNYSKTFVFSTGTEVYRFQTTMAKDSTGSPKDSYTYSSQIHYKASADTQPTAAKSTEERALIIGYNELSCVRVQASWGAAPTDTVQRIQIHFNYPGVSLSSATADVYLTPDHTTDSWFTYTNGNPSVEYEYTITYFLISGQTLAMPMQTGQSGSLVINAPFDDELSVTFVPQGNFMGGLGTPAITAIVVSTTYTDTTDGYHVNGTHSFTNPTDTWLWEFPLHDKAQRTFQYKADITYSDGSADQGDWIQGKEGTILVGAVARQILEIDVIASLLDFQNTWKLVIVKLNYTDPANQIAQSQNFQITGANASVTQSWKVALKNPAVNQYTYEVDAYAIDPTKNKTVGPLQTSTLPLVLQL